MIAYTYYEVPTLKEGDHIRIHTILTQLAKTTGRPVIALTLSHTVPRPTYVEKDSVYYLYLPRKTYQLAAKILKWKDQNDLNPLIKATHYIDELIWALKYKPQLKDKTVYVTGSMTLFSFFANPRKTIYDPLANYAQTLHLRAKTLPGILKYGLYLAIHKLQLSKSHKVVYPSHIDRENAERMFKLRNTYVIPNPPPICYKPGEYEKLRQRRDQTPHFILLAGSRGKANEEAVRLTIETFNSLPHKTYKLYITGPWTHIKPPNPNIVLTGVVPHEQLKKLLANMDYGLAPIFSHAAGTFLKTLAYTAAGLHLIATPYALAGIDTTLLKNRAIYLIKKPQDYPKAVGKAVLNPPQQRPPPLLCQENPQWKLDI